MFNASPLDRSQQAVFDDLDLDLSGSLEENELKNLSELLVSRGMSEADVDGMVMVMDSSADGVVSLAEFVAWWDATRGDMSAQAVMQTGLATGECVERESTARCVFDELDENGTGALV
mmetsp:Transcript_33241/g.40197  ORF Transcript_33241/g.40197 Transcript_33241/m.40197 type:complete len:118 (+) Transcript_33241:2-355(+)